VGESAQPLSRFGILVTESQGAPECLGPAWTNQRRRRDYCGPVRSAQRNETATGPGRTRRPSLKRKARGGPTSEPAARPGLPGRDGGGPAVL